MRRFLTSVVAATMLLGPLGAIAGAPSKYMSRTNGHSASAEWYKETAGTGYYEFILADASDQGNTVIAQTCTIDLVSFASACWTGYAFPSNAVFSMDKKMNIASLSPVSVVLWDDAGTTSKTVTVQASWTGQGNALKAMTNVNSKYGTFKENYKDRATLRNASASAQIDSSPLDGFLDGIVATYRSADFIIAK